MLADLRLGRFFMMASLEVSIVGMAVLALLIFWLIGASSRLARLRTAVGEAFSAWDKLQSNKLDWVAGNVQDLSSAGLAPAALARLDAAAGQLRLSLASARSRPHDSGVIASLCLARQIMQAVWRGVRGKVDPSNIEAADSAALDEWGRLVLQEQPLVAAFNEAVVAYNAAVHQFPAVLVARLFRFRPGRTLVGLEEQV